MGTAVAADPSQPAEPGAARPETPAGPLANAPAFGSDAMAETLRALGIPYIALNPGSSFRGLHDSLVNYLGNQTPQMLLCLHEEHAVAIAHGYAKVTGRIMAAAVHSNVGLMHATMAVFNAWCDRMPLLLLGATGPVDAAKRRPWIDWIHTARDQGALVRHYVKWDDQPASAEAAREAIVRAAWLAETAPRGPVYINLDAEVQETPLADPLEPFDAARHAPKVAASAGEREIEAIAALIGKAARPLLLIGRVSRSLEDWQRRVAFAEAIGTRVLTDLKVGAAFPTDHPLHGAPGGSFPTAAAARLLAQADLVISLDWVDLAGTLEAGRVSPAAKIVQVSLDHMLHNGWSMDHQALPPVDLLVPADPDRVIEALLAPLSSAPARPPWGAPNPVPSEPPVPQPIAGRILSADLAAELRLALRGCEVSLLHLPISWEGGWWHFRHPLDYIGTEGGAGIGGGPGIAVGAALALRGSGRLPVAVLGDGDFLMGATAIWTATRYRIPMLIVIANNRSFFNDEMHQERVARMRGRPIENRWIGQKMIDPDIDLALIAKAQGAQGYGPVKEHDQLAAAYREALAVVQAGGVAVVDVQIEPGYPAGLEDALRGEQGS